MDGIVAAVEANRTRDKQVRFILLSSREDAEVLTRVGADHIMGYLTRPVRLEDLKTAIHMAMSRFEAFLRVLQEAQDLAEALADHKLIERAKGVLMKRRSVGEEEACRRLVQLAQDKNQKLIDVARAILTVEEALQAPENSRSRPKP